MNEREIETYLQKYNYANDLNIAELWAEMDRIWLSLGLDNSKKIESQVNIGKFYSHPVWILNGLFSALDSDSIKHRESIANYLLSLPSSLRLRVADVGGGSGVLANSISSKLGSNALVDIIEPYPSEYFLRKNQGNAAIRYIGSGEKQAYDVVVIQDVLEHVDDPIDMTFNSIELLKNGGHAIFASCFYPVILCHLPGTFYLRHTFKYLLNIPGLSHIGHVPGVPHALIFQKTGHVNLEDLRQRDGYAKYVGRLLNWLQKIKSKK